MFGPTIIFDKSALQALNINESCWLDRFFFSNITPLFYIETLADLEKRVKCGQTPEEIVGALAKKTPSINCAPNVFHHTLTEGNLKGYAVPMRNRPVVPLGTRMQSTLGTGIHYQQFPEMDAFQRWRRGDYLTIERSMASQWRKTLASYSFAPELALIKDVASHRFMDFTEIKMFVDQLIQSNQSDLIHSAPYATHVLKIDLFFYLGMAANLISTRRSNKADIAYLYYLPFTNIFTSGDKLHEKIVPLFMETNQVFIKAQELKSALRKLDDHYSKLPEEIKAQGIIRFAPHPPIDCETLVSNIWDRFRPGWRQNDIHQVSPDDNAKVEYLEKAFKKVIPIRSEDRRPDELDYIYTETEVPRKKGKWDIFPEGID
jgi:hypothetical protein